MERRIAAIPANTLTGIAIKLRIATEDLNEEDMRSSTNANLESALADAERLLASERAIRGDDGDPLDTDLLGEVKRAFMAIPSARVRETKCGLPRGLHLGVGKLPKLSRRETLARGGQAVAAAAVFPILLSINPAHAEEDAVLLDLTRQWRLMRKMKDGRNTAWLDAVDAHLPPPYRHCRTFKDWIIAGRRQSSHALLLSDPSSTVTAGGLVFRR